MASLFSDLMVFFGLDTAPANFAEFVPWMFSALCAMGFVLFCFNMIRSMVNGVNRSRW